MKKFIAVTSLIMNLLLLSNYCQAQQYEGTIIDVQVHASKEDRMNEKFSDFEKYKITQGAISGPWSLTEQVRARGKGKFLYGLMFPCPNNFNYSQGTKCFDTGNEYPDTLWVKKQIEANKIDFLGKLTNQFYGISPADASLDPYYRLAVQYNLPVGVHLALADARTVFKWAPNFKASLGNPLLLEEVVKKYPKLRVSDQMFWPEAISISIKTINSTPFLSEKEKRDILYNNAARFLGLSEEVIARHHQKQKSDDKMK